MNEKDLYSIREWAPLTNVVDSIPARTQRGFFPVDLNITCVDAVCGFIALGSDAGITFWYNRRTGEVQKLKSEVSSRITCVKIVNSVEYMVAAGNATGQVNVFQIQKELPPDLNLVAPCTRAKPIERYTITDMHRSPVSCCEWSKNGMKLYSGNQQGVVVLTEFDYQEHISKSMEILSESYEIIQISVCQNYLLVSSLYRSIICQRNISTGHWQIKQVGKKDRKLLTDCGGTFLRMQDMKRIIAVCGRPGMRLWLADTEGNVEKTLLFKELVARSPTWEIPILNPKISFHQPQMAQSESSVDTKNFRDLLIYPGNDSLVITHDGQTLYVLNIDCLKVEAVAKGFRKILDICVSEKEIFVLEGERSLLRLAPAPEKPNKTAKIIFNPLMPPPVPVLPSAATGAFESPVEFEPVQDTISNAEEVFELPPIEKLDLNIPIELAVESPRAEQNRRLEIFNQISEMEFDQSILHHSGILSNAHGRKKHKSRDHNKIPSVGASSSGIVEIGHAADVTEKMQSIKQQQEGISKPKTLELTTKPTIMNASFCSTIMNTEEMNEFSRYLPELPTPCTLKRTIEAKAKTLAEELGLPTVCLQPITDEEYHISKIAAAPQTETENQTKVSTLSLTDAYPQQLLVEDAGCQTTPCKKTYYIEDSGDYSNGQPVDDICQELRSTTLVEALDDHLVLNAAIPTNAVSSEATGLRYIPTQPLCEEIDSFLPNFPHEQRSRRESTPPSTESNTSSEWEFVGN